MLIHNNDNNISTRLDAMNEKVDFRAWVLDQFGISGTVKEELLRYNRNIFDHTNIENIAFPLEDEPFVRSWETYAKEAQRVGVFHALKTRLVQLNFPIEAGISETDAYRNATRKGILCDEFKESRELQLQSPDKLTLVIHQTPAGKIPLLTTHEKGDFITLLRALTLKNEPASVPDSQGAAMIAGYNNWDRLGEIKQRLQCEKGEDHVNIHWPEEFKKIIPQKHLYQDKFILLSRDYYSGVLPEEIGLEAEEWKDLSLIIRREHECTHYVTKRVLSSMQNNILDEFIADYAGITAAIGKFRADWFLRFVGLERYPEYRDGGRLQNYRRSLSDNAFLQLQRLLYHVALHVEAYEKKNSALEHKRKHLVFALTYLTLEELASEKAPDMIDRYKRL